MVIPILETDRLVLRPPCSDCELAYQRFYTDGGASGMYGGPLTPVAAWARLATDLGSWGLQGFGVWAIRRKAEGDVVGVCGFWQGQGWPRELTWWLLPHVRGLGLAKEASAAAVAHAYSVYGWPEVRTYMADENEQARRLVLSLGGRKVGRECFPDGLERDLYSIPPPGR